MNRKKLPDNLWGVHFFVDLSSKKRYSIDMKENLEKIAEQDLHLTGAKKQRFVREAEALRANLLLRQKQQKERQKKCMRSK